MKFWKVEFQGHDWLEMRQHPDGSYEIKAKGCFSLLKAVEQWRQQSQTLQPLEWNLPSAHDHASMLLRELLLKVQGRWQNPYPHEELCHCRMVNTNVVENAILSGAHDPATVTRWTGASGACGTCRSDVEKILKVRLHPFQSDTSDLCKV